MATNSPPQDTIMTDSQTSFSMSNTQSTPPNPLSTSSDEPKYGGFTRFEIELEFVQSLASPHYLNHLASQKYFENPSFIAYLSYLQYFSSPPYTKFLTYPGPTLRNLELLQQERFRSDILSLETVWRMVEEGGKEAVKWASSWRLCLWARSREYGRGTWHKWEIPGVYGLRFISMGIKNFPERKYQSSRYKGPIRTPAFWYNTGVQKHVCRDGAKTTCREKYSSFYARRLAESQQIKVSP